MSSPAWENGDMSLVRRESLAEQAADLLLSRIRGGEWNVGDKLPGETTLAPQLGVGRSTVREAIRQLAGQGVLASRQGAGVFVTALDIPENWDAVLHRADIVAVIELASRSRSRLPLWRPNAARPRNSRTCAGHWSTARSIEWT